MRLSLLHAKACMAADPPHPVDPVEHTLRLGKANQGSPRGQELGGEEKGE